MCDLLKSTDSDTFQIIVDKVVSCFVLLEGSGPLGTCNDPFSNSYSLFITPSPSLSSHAPLILLKILCHTFLSHTQILPHTHTHTNSSKSKVMEIYIYIMSRKVLTSVVDPDPEPDPDPYWIRIQELCGSGSVFRIRIRIHTFKNRIKKETKGVTFTVLRYKLTIQ